MLSFNRRGDRVISIDVTDLPTKNLRPVQWDMIAAELDEGLGGNWRVAKLGAYWHIINRDNTTQNSTDTTSLPKAIGQATGLAIIKKV